MPDDARCTLPDNDPLFEIYHGAEWGVPVTDDRQLFEKVCLEGFQSGLSWRTILHRREGFRKAFDHFDALKIAEYSESDVERLMQDAAIIRNQRKIRSVLNNAQRAAELKDEFGSLARFFWSYEPDQHTRPSKVTHQWLANNPQTAESQALATALKKRGWSFTGPTNMYALMQAMGIVNDHVHKCPERARIEKLRNALKRP